MNSSTRVANVSLDVDHQVLQHVTCTVAGSSNGYCTGSSDGCYENTASSIYARGTLLEVSPRGTLSNKPVHGYPSTFRACSTLIYQRRPSVTYSWVYRRPHQDSHVFILFYFIHKETCSSNQILQRTDVVYKVEKKVENKDTDNR